MEKTNTQISHKYDMYLNANQNSLASNFYNWIQILFLNTNQKKVSILVTFFDNFSDVVKIINDSWDIIDY